MFLLLIWITMVRGLEIAVLARLWGTALHICSDGKQTVITIMQNQWKLWLAHSTSGSLFQENKPKNKSKWKYAKRCSLQHPSFNSKTNQTFISRELNVVLKPIMKDYATVKTWYSSLLKTVIIWYDPIFIFLKAIYIL